MSVLREASGTRWLTLAASAVILSVLAVAVWAMFGLSGGKGDDRAFAQANGEVCPNPVDISLVFDHTGSMDDQPGKIEAAVAAATGFVNAFAGGAAEPSLSPHDMALVGFWKGIAELEVPLGTNAQAIRDVLDTYDDTSPDGTDGYTHIGRALQLGQIELLGGTDPDYAVLMSDGAANVPQDVDNANTSSVNNDFYIDVNGNGYVDTGDDLSVDFPDPENDPGPGDAPDFVVEDGLWIVNRSASSPVNEMDVSGNGSLGNNDNYNFDGDVPNPPANFRIIKGALYLDANGDGNFAENGSQTSFSPGHTDELAVLRNGSVWGGSSNFSGDGADVYTYYWATQTKSTGTFLYVIGYELGGEQDAALLSLMASPGGYFPGAQNDINGIFQNIAQAICGVQVEKTGDELSKVGDNVSYEITISNPFDITIYKQSIIDDVLGDLTDGTDPNIVSSDCGASLDPLESCTITLTYTVQPGDPDPLINTVNILYNQFQDFSGVALTSSDTHEVNLFQPEVTVTKTGDDLSKVGDEVTYKIGVCNTGSVDSPDLIVNSVVDDLLGDLTSSYTQALAPGQCESHDFPYTVKGGDPDPLVNKVEVHYHPDGFENDITDTDTHSTNLFQPSITLDKTGPALSKAGDDVTYTVVIENTSSPDSPDLMIEKIEDSLQGDLTKPANYDSSDCGASLAAGASCTIVYTYTVQGDDPDPLVNTASVETHPEGFPNDIDASDEHSINLFGPSITLDKKGPALSKVGDDVTYTVVIENTSSANAPDLVIEKIEDSLQGDLTNPANYDSSDCGASLAAGASCTIVYTYTVQGGDPDPLINVASVETHPEGFPNDIDADDEHEVNLFQPEVTVTKTGDDLSKVGDGVTYTIEVCNTGSVDSPDLIVNSVVDSLLGDLTSSYTQALASDQCESHNFPYTVQGGDPDPLVNEVEVHYHPDGFENDITDTDTHSTNLFQPSIQFDKTGDSLSKVGDSVAYTITLDNTSSGDSPDLECNITDALLGIDENVTLASGEDHVINKSRTVQAGDGDPLVNEAAVTCSPIGFPNVLEASDTHSTNLFQPEVTVTKTGDDLSKVGDEVTYTIGVCNTGSVDSPDLIVNSVVDDLLGDLTSSYTQALAPGQCESHDFPYTVKGGDPDPLVNEVEVHYHPDGFENDITDTDTHSTNLFQPSIQFDKTGDALSKVGDSVAYTITLENTSSDDAPDLVCNITDALLGIDENVTLASKASYVINESRTVQAGDEDPLVNEAAVTCSPIGFPNVLEAGDTHSTNLFQPEVTVTKTGDDLSKVGDGVTYTIKVCNTGSVDSPDLIVNSVVDDLLGDLTSSYTQALAPEQCESHNFPYTVKGGDPDPLVNEVEVHYHPDGFENDITDTDTHSTNLFQPSISFDKTGDSLSKVGDDVAYMITLKNTSSDDAPDLVCNITDALLGIDENVTLASEASYVINKSRTVQAGDGDPLVNEAAVACSPIGFPNVLEASDDHSTNLFQPSISFDKTGDSLSKVGDDVAYTITLKNTSSDDAPDLVCNIKDALLGIDENVTLASKASHVISASREVQAGDEDPLVNEASVACSPIEFPNVLEASDTHEVNLFQPAFTLTKVCSPESASVGDTITYTLVITNTSSSDSPSLNRVSVEDSLLGDISDAFPASLAPGASATIDLTRDIESGDPDPLLNEVSAVYQVDGFPNQLSASAACSVANPTPTPAPTPTAAAATATPAPTPTPTPAALPETLPPTGGQGPLAGGSASLILLVIIGAALIGGSAWSIWGNHYWGSRR